MRGMFAEIDTIRVGRALGPTQPRGGDFLEVAHTRDSFRLTGSGYEVVPKIVRHAQSVPDGADERR